MAVLARDSVNFGFLSAHDPLLVHYAAQAEQYFATDPTAALIKLRRFAEILAQKAAATVGVYTDDIFWYRAAQELDSGVSLVWYMNGANPPVPRNFAIHRDYTPHVADFDLDGCSDIMWYEANRPSSTPLVWTCMNEANDFDCQSGLELPTNGYLVGWNGGGY